MYDFTTVPDRSAAGSNKWDDVGATVDCVPLSVADMEFVTAPPIKEALHNLLDTTVLGYTHPTEAYYDSVISWMKRRHDFDVKKEWVYLTPGVVNALALLIDAMTKPGDSVLVLTPVYYPFDMAVLAQSRKILYSTLINNDGHYEIDFADLEAKCARKDVTALLFCSPHNPVGRVWTREELERVGNICCDNGVFIIDDEIHHDLIMPGYEHIVMSTLSERIQDNIAVCTAPSKTFNLAGVQCSNIIIPNERARAKTAACGTFNMQTHLNVFAPTACRAAYDSCEGWLEELISVIDGNAKFVESFMAEHFPEIKCIPLEGTYLQWLDLRGLGMNHMEQKKMLLEQKIYLDNGEMFGLAGRGFQRINLACARSTLEKMLLRFKEGVENVRKSWEENGKPFHQQLTVGKTMESFTYTNLDGNTCFFHNKIRKTTLLIFARWFTCDVSQELLSTFKKVYPVLKLMGYDVKMILQDSVETLAPHKNEYPFELIPDPDCRLYDRYNVFEADSITGMMAGDPMFEKMVNNNVKNLLDTDLIYSLLAAAGGPQAPSEHRDNQLCAMVGLGKDLKIRFVHYCGSISDFPDTKTMLTGLRG